MGRFSGRQPTFVECLSGTDPQSLVGAKDIPLVHLQFFAEMVDDGSSHELGIMRRSSDARFSALQGRQRAVLILVDANSFSQVGIVA